MKNITATIYGREHCDLTKQTTQLCEDKQIPYKFKDGTDKDNKHYLADELGPNSYYLPVIFLNNDFIGNYQSLYNHLTN